MNTKEIAEAIVLNLNELEIGCYLYHSSKNNESHYIRFQNANIGSIRVSTHQQKEQYSYKYNIQTDVKSERGFWKKDTNGNWQFFLGAENWNKIIDIIIGANDYRKNWSKKREYVTPKFKQKESKKGNPDYEQFD